MLTNDSLSARDKSSCNRNQSSSIWDSMSSASIPPVWAGNTVNLEAADGLGKLVYRSRPTWRAKHYISWHCICSFLSFSKGFMHKNSPFQIAGLLGAETVLHFFLLTFPPCPILWPLLLLPCSTTAFLIQKMQIIPDIYCWILGKFNSKLH